MTDPITGLNAALEDRYRIEREIGEVGWRRSIWPRTYASVDGRAFSATRHRSGHVGPCTLALTGPIPMYANFWMRFPSKVSVV